MACACPLIRQYIRMGGIFYQTSIQLEYKVQYQSTQSTNSICSKNIKAHKKDPSSLASFLFISTQTDHFKAFIIKLIIRTMADQKNSKQIMNHPHIITPLFENSLINGLFRGKLAQNEQLRHQEQPIIPTMPLNTQLLHQMNSDQFDQIPFDHLNFVSSHKFPHLLNVCPNPESQSHESGNKMRHIQEMNKSVKQIMRCNQEYRGELLSAYQNKTKVQLENAILIKEKQHLQDQKQMICAELEESSKKVVVLQNSIKRLKQNHKKTNDKLKQNIQHLHNELNALRNTKFDLENKSNQNNLFLKTIHNNELKIKKLEQGLFSASNQSLQLKADLSALKEKLNYVEIEKNHLILVNTDQKRTIENLESQLKKMQVQNEDLNTRFKALNWQYDSIRRQNQHERSRYQKLLHRLQQAEKNDQERCRQLQSSQRQFNNLMQAYLSVKSQHEQLKSLPIELQTARTINQSFTDEITKKQLQVESLNYANAKQFQQIQKIRLEYARLFCEFQAFKESTSIGAQNCIQDYESQIYSLRLGYQSQIKAFSQTVHRLQEENDRLMNVVFKKQEFIKGKEQQISRHLQAILQLQSKVTLINRAKQQKTSTLLSNISELQVKLIDRQALIQQLQQTTKQLKSQNLQILKRQIASIALKDSQIASLEKNLAHKSQQNDKAIKKMLVQQQQQNKAAEERQQSLNKQLQCSKTEIITLQNDILTQSQTIDAIRKQLQAKITIVAMTTNDNKKLKTLCEDLKGQISVIEAQYDIIKNELGQQCRQKHQIAQRLQSEQRKSQKLLRISQKYANQIEQLKTKVHLIESKRLNAKRQYEHQISQLNESLGMIRVDHVRYRNIVDSLDSIYKQIHLIEQVQRALTNDPKISIARFSHHITALHRQAFTREVQKINKYFGTVNNIGEEIRKIVDCLKLSANAINKGFEVTFSERRMNSVSILCDK